MASDDENHYSYFAWPVQIVPITSAQKAHYVEPLLVLTALSTPRALLCGNQHRISN